MKPQAHLADGLYHLRYLISEHEVQPQLLITNFTHRYNFPYQIFCSCVYPLPSPNGSTIIICGHEQGLLILWRGGRPYKPLPKPSPKPQMANGTSKAELIDIDMADESASEESTEPETGREEDFEDKEQDFNPNTPYLPLLEQLDVPVGLAVLSISVPAITYSVQSPEFGRLPEIAQKCIIITATCADASTRIITLPLLLPHLRTRRRLCRLQKSKPYIAGSGLWGERVYTLQGTTVHQTQPQGLSVALVPQIVQQSIESKAKLMDESQLAGSGSRLWDLLIASHSHDLAGLLLIHKVSVPSTGLDLLGEDGTSTSDWLWRDQQLLRPAKSIHLRASQKTAGTNPLVLVVEPNDAIRTYKCDPESPSGSGSWSIAIFPDLESSDPTKTKSLIDAKLILGGDAIATVTSEGTWGLYDLKHITGAMPTKATATGSIGKSVVGLDGNTVGTGKLGSKMAPMTPGTRKVRQEKLFAGSSQKPSTSSTGGVCLSSAGDSMTVWYGDRMSTISNLQSYLDRTPQELRNPLAATTFHHVHELNLAVNGPPPTSLSVIENPRTSSGKRVTQPDVLITGQRSMTIITPPLTDAPAPVSFPTIVEGNSTEQKLLTRGDLTIDGVDKMLARLEADKGIKDGEDLFTKVKNKGRTVFTNGTSGK